MRKWEQHKTNKWVRSSYVSAYAYAYVAGVLTCYAYVLVKTSLYVARKCAKLHAHILNFLLPIYNNGGFSDPMKHNEHNEKNTMDETTEQ